MTKTNGANERIKREYVETVDDKELMEKAVSAMTEMTGTRLVFAAVSTLYLVVAIPFEERQMRRTMGSTYDDYSGVVRWRMLPGIY